MTRFASMPQIWLVAGLIASIHNIDSAQSFGMPIKHNQLSNMNKHATKLDSTARALSDVETFSKDTDAEIPPFLSREDYTMYLAERSGLPQGFQTGVASGNFLSVEAPALGYLNIRATVIHLPDGPTDTWAACFTKNKFPGAPIKVGKDLLAKKSPLQALVINNKVSNVCSGTPDGGISEALEVCESVATLLKLEHGRESVLPSSTGVIGWRLPSKELAEDVVPEAISNLRSDSALMAADAICTTDRYPKLRSKTLSNGSRIIAFAKGAGMIEPNMATMLCYILTDATLPAECDLQSILTESVNTSFNSISVDGDESTSDTVVLVSSQKIADTDMDEFTTELNKICTGLASDLVRNGEGTAHVMRVAIDNFPGTDLDARKLGRHIVNSPLFKCAVSGNDPNTGRLAGAIGSFLGKMDSPPEKLDTMTLTLGGRVIFAEGKFVLEGDAVERELSDHMKGAEFGEIDDYPMHQKFVEIGVDFGEGQGDGKAVVLGSDLTAEYVSINADYRS